MAKWPTGGCSRSAITERLDHTVRPIIVEGIVSKGTKLTTEEKEILDAYESGNHNRLPEARQLIEKYARYAKEKRNGTAPPAEKSSEQ